MKRQLLYILAVTIFGLFLGASTATSDGNNSDQLTDFYESFINDKVAQCFSRTGLIKSSSSNIQNWAEKEFKKAVFLSENKNLLIKELIKNDIGRKPYKIEYFLNKKFYEMKLEEAKKMNIALSTENESETRGRQIVEKKGLKLLDEDIE